jgi:arylsulfatase A-like enzyme
VLATRAALIGGRNHHVVGMGAITEFATSASKPTPTSPVVTRACGAW